MIEFKSRELPKIAQNQTLFLNHSQIKVDSYVTIICPYADLIEFQLIAHCSVSSNSFHGQITQKAVHQISDPENKICSH